MLSIKDTFVWLYRFFLYKPLPKKQKPVPDIETVVTFDKTGWTRCDTGFGFNTPGDRFAPIEIMREGWDEPAVVASGWSSMNPMMNIVGLYWRMYRGD